MPYITGSKEQEDGQTFTSYSGFVDSSPRPYQYKVAQDLLRIVNRGNRDITVTIGGSSTVVAASKEQSFNGPITQFTVSTAFGFQAFIAESWIKSSSSSGGGGNGSGVLVVANLTELQTSYPNGATAPVWVTSENSWYYWSGDVPAPDTTAPIVTASVAAGTYSSAQSVTLLANETASIFYTTNGDTPTINSTPYTGAITISASTTLKFIGRDSAGNVSSPVSVAYTISVADTTPPSPASNFAAGTPTSNTVPTTWTASPSGDVAKYEAAYSLNGTDFTVANGNVSAAATSYTFTGLTESTAYTFRLVAIDGANNRSTVVTTTATTAAAVPGALTSVTSGMLHSYDLRGGTVGATTGTVADSVGTMPLTLTNFKTDSTEGFVAGGLKHAGTTDAATGSGYANNTTVANLGMATGSSFTVILKASLNASNYTTNFFTTTKDNQGIHIDTTPANTLGRFAIATTSAGALRVHPVLKVRDSTSATTDIIRDDSGTASSSIPAGASPTPFVAQVTYDSTTKTASLYLNGTLNKSMVLTNHLKFDGINLCSGQKVDHALLIYNRVLSGTELTQVSTDLLALS